MRHLLLTALLAATSLQTLSAADPAQQDPRNDPAVKELSADLEKLNPRSEADLEKIFLRIDRFASEHKDHPATPQLQGMKVQLLQQFESDNANKLLEALTKDPNPKVAEAAKELVAQRKTMEELKSKPLDLKFTTTTGEEFDLAKMRGKVVLIDFWASWCGPCISEMPNVVAYYEKMHDKGLEVVGISLDKDKDKMEAAIKKNKMPWPQYFDGLGWKNKISTKYGINSIPRLWVIDKEGKLSTTTSRLTSIESKVDELLK